MFKNLSYVSISFIYINLLGYLFHIIVSRQLGPVKYGEFIVYYSLILVGSNVAGILGNISVKKIIENPELKFETLRFFRIFNLIVGLIFFLLIIIFSGIISDFLNLTGSFYLYLVALAILLALIVTPEKSLIQADKNFKSLSIINSTELTMRFFFAIILIFSGYEISGAILSTPFALLMVFFVLLYLNNHVFGKINPIHLKTIIITILYISPMSIVIYFDSIFVTRVFSYENAGIYGSFSVLGKTALYFCLTLFNVFFPEFLLLKDSKKMYKIIRLANILTFSIYIVIIIVVILVGKPIYEFLFGYQYISGFQYLVPYLIALIPLTLNSYNIGLLTVLEKYLPLIYFYLISYLAGFIILDLSKIIVYIGYIFLINFVFYLVFLIALFLSKKNHSI